MAQYPLETPQYPGTVTDSNDGSASGSGSGSDLDYVDGGSGYSGSGSGSGSGDLDDSQAPLDIMQKLESNSDNSNSLLRNHVAIRKLSEGNAINLSELGGLVISVQSLLAEGIDRQSFVEAMEKTVVSYDPSRAKELIKKTRMALLRVAALFDYMNANRQANLVELSSVLGAPVAARPTSSQDNSAVTVEYDNETNGSQEGKNKDEEDEDTKEDDEEDETNE